jgi:hypothetical protein
MAKKGNKSRPQTDAEMMGVINAAGNKVDSNKILEGLIRDYVTNSLSDGTSEGEYASEYGGFDGDADAWFGTEQGADYLESVRDKLSDSVDNTKVFGGCGTDAGSQISTDSGYNPCSTEFDAGAAEQFLLEQIENASKETSKELYSWNAGDDAAFSARDILDALVPAQYEQSVANFLGLGLSDEEKAGSAKFQSEVDAARKYTQGRQITFKEQCFLLTNILAFTSAKTVLDLTYPGIYTKELPDIVSFGSAGNRSIMTHGEPFSFINRLTQSPTKSFLHALRNEELSTLQPQIRLFKVVSDGNGKEYEAEIKFDSHLSKFDLDDLLSNKSVRGKGVGIRSFNFGYEADNPFSIKKSITAKLVLFANTFGELLQDRETFYYDESYVQQSHIYKYTDLALKTGGNAFLKRVTNSTQNSVALTNAQKLNFRLKAVVGWADPRGTGGLGSGAITARETLDAVNNSYITLNLTPTIHDFDIDDLGRVTFTLNYLAYIEDFFDQPSFDIFANPDTVAKQTTRKVKIAALETKCGAKNVSDIKNEPDEKDEIQKEKLQNLRSLMTAMISKKRLRIIDVPIDELNKYRVGGPTAQGRVSSSVFKTFVDKLVKEIETVQSTASGAQDAAADRQIQRAQDAANNPDDGIDGNTVTTSSAADVERYLDGSNPIESVTFFWASDLIDVILDNIGGALDAIPITLNAELTKMIAAGEPKSVIDAMREEIQNYKRYIENFRRMRVILGPLELVDENLEGQALPTSVVSNLGDIPISAKYFMEWLTTKMLKVERVRYPLASFLNDFFNQFVRDFLNNDPCYGGAIKQKVRVGQTAITAYRSKTKDLYKEDLEYYARNLSSVQVVPIVDVGTLPSPVLNVMGDKGGTRSYLPMSEEYNYMAYYASRVQPMDVLQGVRSDDEARGVFHYGIGRDRGIVKNISLQKTQTPGLAEVRFEQEGFDGLQQLLVLYDANIKTFLDVSAFPGAYIYVEPKSFDPALNYDITKLGVGGYFMITRADHSLGPGLAETNITAKWVAQVNREAEQLSQQNTQECTDLLNNRKATTTLTSKKSFLSTIFSGFGFGGS